jgi:hypothetical protein
VWTALKQDEAQDVGGGLLARQVDSGGSEDGEAEDACVGACVVVFGWSKKKEKNWSAAPRSCAGPSSFITSNNTKEKKKNITLVCILFFTEVGDAEPEAAVVNGALQLRVGPINDERVDEIHAVRQARDDGEGVRLEEAPDGPAFALDEWDWGGGGGLGGIGSRWC